MFTSRRKRQRIIIAIFATLGIALGALSYNVHLLDSNLQAAVYDTYITNSPGKLSNQVTIVALACAVAMTVGVSDTVPKRQPGPVGGSSACAEAGGACTASSTPHSAAISTIRQSRSMHASSVHSSPRGLPGRLFPALNPTS